LSLLAAALAADRKVLGAPSTEVVVVAVFRTTTTYQPLPALLTQLLLERVVQVVFNPAQAPVAALVPLMEALLQTVVVAVFLRPAGPETLEMEAPTNVLEMAAQVLGDMLATEVEEATVDQVAGFAARAAVLAAAASVAAAVIRMAAAAALGFWGRAVMVLAVTGECAVRAEEAVVDQGALTGLMAQVLAAVLVAHTAAAEAWGIVESTAAQVGLELSVSYGPATPAHSHQPT
jgi:hypothetical protein